MLGLADDVCLVIDMECFHIRGRWWCRELGYCSWRGDSGRVGFLPPLPKHHLRRDECRHVDYLTREIHGLSYQPDKREHIPDGGLHRYLRKLYDDTRTTDRCRVAFKGGNFEKTSLRQLSIPFLDLETLGCPKYDDLRRTVTGEQTCGWHATPNRHHCAMAECRAFFDWYRRFLLPALQDEPMEWSPTSEETPMDL